MKAVSLPFKIKNVFGGLAETEGFLDLSDSGLDIEFQTKYCLFGIKSAVKGLEIKFSDIVEVRFKKGMFTKRLFIRVDSLKISGQFPKSKAKTVCLCIAKKDVGKALELVSEIQGLIAI